MTVVRRTVPLGQLLEAIDVVGQGRSTRVRHNEPLTRLPSLGVAVGEEPTEAARPGQFGCREPGRVRGIPVGEQRRSEAVGSGLAGDVEEMLNFQVAGGINHSRALMRFDTWRRRRASDAAQGRLRACRPPRGFRVVAWC